ncbi:MAG: hypothetical protein LBR74_08925, partial [Eubacterium sp.]|nr:hypothetical protein [Eubacterium sp.]
MKNLKKLSSLLLSIAFLIGSFGAATADFPELSESRINQDMLETSAGLPDQDTDLTGYEDSDNEISTNKYIENTGDDVFSYTLSSIDSESFLGWTVNNGGKVTADQGWTNSDGETKAKIELSGKEGAIEAFSTVSVTNS